jgi:hypothetical protein
MKIIYEIDDEDQLRRAEQFFIQTIRNQSGGYLPFVFTEHGQYGDGIGSFMRGLWRIFRPAVISGAKAVGRQALSTAGDYVEDLARGANWREAGEERLRQAAKNLGSKLEAKFSGQQGSGYWLNQRGGGRRRNKTMHSAVKLFSFVPPAITRGPTSGRVIKRRRKPKRKSKVSGGRSVKGRRRAAKRRGASVSSAATPKRRRRRRPVKGGKKKQKRKTTGGARSGRGRRRQRGAGGFGSFGGDFGGGGGYPSIGWL